MKNHPIFKNQIYYLKTLDTSSKRDQNEKIFNFKQISALETRVNLTSRNSYFITVPFGHCRYSLRLSTRTRPLPTNVHASGRSQNPCKDPSFQDSRENYWWLWILPRKQVKHVFDFETWYIGTQSTHSKGTLDF